MGGAGWVAAPHPGEPELFGSEPSAYLPPGGKVTKRAGSYWQCSTSTCNSKATTPGKLKGHLPLPQPQATFCGARRSKHLRVAPTAAQEERQRALPLPFPRPLRDAPQVDSINPQDARMVSLALNTFTEKALRPERHLWVTSV